MKINVKDNNLEYWGIVKLNQYDWATNTKHLRITWIPM